METTKEREQGFGREIADRIAALPDDYYHEMLAEVANGLELLCGCRRLRLYLGEPWFYGSVEPEILALAYTRGTTVTPELARPMWLSLPHSKRGQSEETFLSAEDTNVGRCYLEQGARWSDHGTAADEATSAALASQGIASSLCLPISGAEGPAGVAVLDFETPVADATLRQITTWVSEFLTRVSGSLKRAKDARNEKILKERIIDQAIRRQRAYLLLRNVVKTGPADMAVLLATDPHLLLGHDDATGPAEPRRLYLIEVYSATRQNKFIFREALDQREAGELACLAAAGAAGESSLLPGEVCSPSELPLPRTGSGPHAVPSWLTAVLPDYTAYFVHPLRVSEDGEIVGVVLLYCRELAGQGQGSEDPGCLLKDRGLESVAGSLTSLLTEPVSNNLVVERLLGIHRLSQAYDRYDAMYNIKQALSLYLHNALTHLTGLVDADYGTVGIVTSLGEREFVLVEVETGQMVGAKVGDLQDMRVPALPIGDEHNLLSFEYSLSGVTAGSRRTTIITDLEQAPQVRMRREFPLGTRSAISIPLLNADNNTAAVVTLSSRRRSHFTAQAQAILESMTALLAEPIESLIKKHNVAEASLKLYGGRYPYIDNAALRELADLYSAGRVILASFMDELLATRNHRLLENPSSSPRVLKEDVDRTFWQLNVQMDDLEDYVADADRQIAETLFRLLKAKQVTFQEAVQSAYTDHRISRRVVRSIITLAFEELTKPQITRVAVLLNACSPDHRGNVEERKKIEQFRQFYYRTVGPGTEE